MKVRFRNGLLVVTAESDDEREQSRAWSAAMQGHVFVLTPQDEQTFRLSDLGVREEACRQPINVTSRSTDPAIRLISNFAHTPFELNGERYASVEAFWQGLKFSEASRRREIAGLHGAQARRAGADAAPSTTFEYGGERIIVGTFDHWQLMQAACWAKFRQHDEARNALAATSPRPLEHKTRRDSRSIPGVIMAEIWMNVRRRLLDEESQDKRR